MHQSSRRRESLHSFT